MSKYKEYRMTGMLDGWKIIRDSVKARTDKEAKSRIRRRYPKIKGVMISGIISPPLH